MQQPKRLSRSTPAPPAEGPRRAWRDALVPAARATIVTLALTGVAHPLLVTGVAQAIFPRQANGGFVEEGGRVVGSELVGQPFSRPGYLHPRPSAAGEGYDGRASGGSNLGPTSVKLREAAKARAEALRKDNPDAPGPIPVELVTASGSGLDPHLSPGAARWQVPRIARARGVAPGRVRAVVEENVEDRPLGMLGEPRVNVLLVNLALDRRFGAPAAR